jgi:hypothetical protein
MPKWSRPISLLTALALLLAVLGGTAAASPHKGHRHARRALHHPVGLGDAVAVAQPLRDAHRRAARRERTAERAAAAHASAPAPAPVAKPANPAGLLFNGEHISDFSLLQAAPGAITEAPDPAGSGTSTIEMTVNNADVAPITPTDNPRAQALSPSIIENGDEFWLSTRFYIPTTMPTARSGWMSLVSIYGPPFASSSPWQIEYTGGNLQWERNATYGWDVPWKTPVIKGSWVTVLLHERFATDGWVEMWINGQPISFFGRETKLNMQTMDSSNGAGPNSAKIMQYRQAGMFETGSVYFGPLKIGTTREAVGG